MLTNHESLKGRHVVRESRSVKSSVSILEWPISAWHPVPEQLPPAGDSGCCAARSAGSHSSFLLGASVWMPNQERLDIRPLPLLYPSKSVVGHYSSGTRAAITGGRDAPRFHAVLKRGLSDSTEMLAIMRCRAQYCRLGQRQGNAADHPSPLEFHARLTLVPASGRNDTSAQHTWGAHRKKR